MEFKSFPKIARFNRECIITEKIDGTNAQIYISPVNDRLPLESSAPLVTVADLDIRAGSRNRWLTSGGKSDNFGFAAWVDVNAEDLYNLGPGRHYGEWWGKGIQRTYGQDEKHFSLFDAVRWHLNPDLPKCCEHVPILGMYQWMPDKIVTEGWIDELKESGSRLATWPAEGIVIYHRQANQAFKVTLEHDTGGKHDTQ